MTRAVRDPVAVDGHDEPPTRLLELHRARWLSRDWEVSCLGRRVATLAGNWRNTSATLRIGSATYRLRRERARDWEVVDGATGSTLAWIHTPRCDTDTAVVALAAGGDGYRLTMRNLMAREIAVTRYGIDVGWIRGRGPDVRVIHAALPDDLHPAVRVFMTWMGLELYRRQEGMLAATLLPLMGT